MTGHRSQSVGPCAPEGEARIEIEDHAPARIVRETLRLPGLVPSVNAGAFFSGSMRGTGGA